jgi:hypothetical protein
VSDQRENEGQEEGDEEREESVDEAAEVLATDVAFWSLGLDNPDTSLKEVGRLAEELAPKYRALAILTLFRTGSSEGFCNGLRRAANARISHLRRLKDAGVTNDLMQASGKYQPLLSAIAADDWAAAKEIVALSPQAKLRGEYEDDHNLAQVVGHLLEEPVPPRHTFAPYFTSWRDYAGEDEDPRLDVLRAIVERDQHALETGFARLAQKFKSATERAQARGQHEDRVVLALRRVDVDALAFLRLAERRGLETAEQYDFFPGPAPVPTKVPFPPV